MTEGGSFLLIMWEVLHHNKEYFTYMKAASFMVQGKRAEPKGKPKAIKQATHKLSHKTVTDSQHDMDWTHSDYIGGRVLSHCAVRCS